MASLRATVLPSTSFRGTHRSVLARLPTLPLAAARLVVATAHRTNAAATDAAPADSEPIMDNALFCYQVGLLPPPPAAACRLRGKPAALQAATMSRGVCCRP